MGKKNRMGMGLDMLFADNSANEKNETAAAADKDGAAMVRLSLLEPNKDQPRENFDDEKLGELADSIRENGVLQPILVRPLENGGYQIVAGERRWRASRLAGLSEVPVYIKELDDRQTMQMALIENIQRQDLSPIEEAAAYKSLIETYGLTQQEAAVAVGKSRSAVANSLRLLELEEGVKALVDSGELSVGHAKVLASLEKEKQQRFADEVKEKGYSVRQLEKAVAAANREDNPPEEFMKKVSHNTFKKERPFVKEFEVSVNDSSNIKVKAKNESDGSVSVKLNIGMEQDIEKVLSKLAQFLEKY